MPYNPRTEKTESEEFLFVVFVKHANDDTSYGRKKTGKEDAVFQKKRSELFGNSKDTMSVFYMNDFERYRSGTVDGILIAIGGTKTAFSTERNKL